PEQRTGRSAENGAGRTFTARVDRTARERARRGADDQSGRAVVSPAVVAAIVAPPVTDAVSAPVIPAVVVVLLVVLAVRWRPPRRVGQGGGRRDCQGCSGYHQQGLTHLCAFPCLSPHGTASVVQRSPTSDERIRCL